MSKIINNNIITVGKNDSTADFNTANFANDSACFNAVFAYAKKNSTTNIEFKRNTYTATSRTFADGLDNVKINGNGSIIQIQYDAATAGSTTGVFTFYTDAGVVGIKNIEIKNFLFDHNLNRTCGIVIRSNSNTAVTSSNFRITNCEFYNHKGYSDGTTAPILFLGTRAGILGDLDNILLEDIVIKDNFIDSTSVNAIPISVNFLGDNINNVNINRVYFKNLFGHSISAGCQSPRTRKNWKISINTFETKKRQPGYPSSLADFFDASRQGFIDIKFIDSTYNDNSLYGIYTDNFNIAVYNTPSVSITNNTFIKCRACFAPGYSQPVGFENQAFTFNHNRFLQCVSIFDQDGQIGGTFSYNIFYETEISRIFGGYGVQRGTKITDNIFYNGGKIGLWKGKITVTTGSVSITGVGTEFTRLAVGNVIKTSNNTLFTIASIVSDTSLTVTVAPTVTETTVNFVRNSDPYWEDSIILVQTGGVDISGNTFLDTLPATDSKVRYIFSELFTVGDNLYHNKYANNKIMGFPNLIATFALCSGLKHEILMNTGVKENDIQYYSNSNALITPIPVTGVDIVQSNWKPNGTVVTNFPVIIVNDTTKLLKAGDTITGDIANTSTGYFQASQGTTAQRPATPLNGMRRYNTTTTRDELYANGAWQNHARLAGDTFTGAITATNLTGSNTGDQTITLTGDVTGTGTGAFVTAIGALKVLGSMIADATINLTTKVIGILPIANGGTGSASQNFVDLTTAQTAAGIKTFSSGIITGNNGIQIGGINNISITDQGTHRRIQSFAGSVLAINPLGNAVAINSSAVPTGSSLYIGGGDVTQSNGSRYLVEMKVPASITAILAATGTLAIGATYYYVVTSSDGSGETIKSVEVSATPTSGNQTINISWAASIGARTYRVYRTTVSGSYTSPALIKIVSSNSYSDTGADSLTSGTPPTQTGAYVTASSSNGNSWFLGGNLGIGINPATALLDIRSDLTTKLTFKIQSLASQTADLINVLDSAGTGKLFAITNTGKIIKGIVARTATVAGAITATDEKVVVNSATATTQTLDSTSTFGFEELYIKNIGAGIVTIATTSAQTIDAGTTVTLSQYQSIALTRYLTNWIVI